MYSFKFCLLLIIPSYFKPSKFSLAYYYIFREFVYSKIEYLCDLKALTFDSWNDPYFLRTPSQLWFEGPEDINCPACNIRLIKDRLVV